VFDEGKRERIKEEKIRNKFFKWSAKLRYILNTMCFAFVKRKKKVIDARGLRSHTLITVISTLNYSPRTKAEMRRDF